MPLDREETLRKAEKLLRQGRLDGAIVEYARVVDEYPRDWTTANALGDLFARANQTDRAVAQYLRIADHFFQEGFLPKAAALYKKILKFKPQDEAAQLQLAEIAIRQGLLADAKAYLAGVADQRRTRGEIRAANEIVVRLGELDPSDLEGRLAAARALVALGRRLEAAHQLEELADELFDRGRRDDAISALRAVVELDAANVAARARLAQAYLAQNNLDGARQYLTAEVAGDDPELRFALLEVELRDGRVEEGRALARDLLQQDAGVRDRLAQLGWELCDGRPESARVCVDLVADAAVAAEDWAAAAAVLHEFVTRVPNQIDPLMRLVEICVDGGLEGTMYQAQAHLADAYLNAGRAVEARVIAEDLVAREPWERSHIERFRQALMLQGETDPDAVIAERLSGTSPFTSTDHFADLLADDESVFEPGSDAFPGPPGEPVPPAVAAEQPAEASFAVAEPAVPADGDASEVFETGTTEIETMEIDLTAALGELAPGQAPDVPGGGADRSVQSRSLDEVFTDFRDEVSRQAAMEAASEQYRLALAYREMGMIDDAIAAFQQAVRSPRHRFDAASALGRLYIERQQPANAIHWLERAAEAPAPTAEDGRALLYDLGATLDVLGEWARALAVFLELQADAGEYRDVAARIDRLARVQAGG